MEWTDEAILLAVRPHGETAAVVDVFTRRHGRHAAFVHGARSRRLRPILQTGNHVDVTWRARLPDQLGHATIELNEGYAARAMDTPATLSALMSLAALLRLLPERDPHPNLFEVSLFVLSFLDDDTVWPALYARWELMLLEECGFGLDLTQCAATGHNDDLIYVSPKTGRAVSASAGAPYKDRLLRLPAFLLGGRDHVITAKEIGEALQLTGFFLHRRVLGPREEELPECRQRLVRAIANDVGSKSPNAS